MHQPHRLRAELISMIDRGHARLDRKPRPRLTCAMHTNASPHPRRLLHRNLKLRLRVLVRSNKLPIHLAVLARLINLDEIRALLELLANHIHQLGSIVRIVGIPRNMRRRIVVDRVLMPAHNADRVPAHPHPRPRNQPRIDRIANRRVRRTRTLRPHVAFSGKSGHQIVARRKLGKNRPLRDRLLNRLQVLRTRMQKQMHMRIDQPRHQRRIAQVDHLRPRRTRHRSPRLYNLVAFNQHLTRRNNLPRRHIQQPRRMKHNHPMPRVRSSLRNHQSTSHQRRRESNPR